LENIYTFRKLSKEDIPNILEIYNYYIQNGLQNFEENIIPYDEFYTLCNNILNADLPFIVCEKGDGIVGFAYLNTFRNKSGYKHSFENTVYVQNIHKGKGIGNNLLKKLVFASRKNLKIKNIIAVIGSHDPNASIKIHEKNGFDMIGTIKKAGFKKNQWVDAIYMQKILDDKN